MAAFALFPAMDSARRMSESKASGPRADRMFFIFSASASIVEKNTKAVAERKVKQRERERYLLLKWRGLRCIFILEWDLARKGGGKRLVNKIFPFSVVLFGAKWSSEVLTFPRFVLLLLFLVPKWR